MRTSHTHPLRIAAIPCPQGGTLGITFCPGKWQPAAITGAWSRDLTVDIEAIRVWGAALVLTLVTPEELHALRVPTLGQAIAQAGIGWHHLPIEDVSIPSPAWEESWFIVRDEVHAALDGGARVLVHCKGGLGRAGLVAARLLIERGMAPDAALTAVRTARPGAVETAEQEAYLSRQEAHRGAADATDPAAG